MNDYGKTYTFELKTKLMGFQSHESAKTIISELNLPLTPEEFNEATKKQFELIFPDTQVMPGKFLMHFLVLLLWSMHIFRN